jgi:uncharacterized membrane protein
MPTETIIAISAVLTAFIVFAAALYWAEHQTRTTRQ